MPTIKPLPSSVVLDWHDKPSLLGGVRHVAYTNAPALAGAFGAAPERQGASLTQFLKPRQGAKTLPPRNLDATRFAALKRIDGPQRDVAEVVAHAPNNVSSIAGSLGESVARYEMAQGNFDEDGQYTKQTGCNAAISGSGVCTQTNTLLYDVLVGAEQHEAELAQQARSRGDSSRPPFKPLPVALVVNGLPHVYVQVGDEREPGKLLNADAFGALVVAKDMANTTYGELPSSVRSRSVAGAGNGGRGMTSAQLSALVAQRPSRSAVDDYLVASDRPAIGRHLLQDIVKDYDARNARLDHFVLTAREPALGYVGPEGEFQPGIDSAAYQRQRHAEQLPEYAQLVALHERRGNVD